MEIIKTITLILYMGGDVAEHTAYEKRYPNVLKPSALLKEICTRRVSPSGTHAKTKPLRYQKMQMALATL